MKIGFAFIINNQIYNWNHWKTFFDKNNYKIGIINYGDDIDSELEQYKINSYVKPGYGNIDYIKCVLILLRYLKDCDRVVLLSESCFPLVSFSELEKELSEDKMYIELYPFDKPWFYKRIPQYILKKIGVNPENANEYKIKSSAQGIVFNKKMIEFYLRNQNLLKILENDIRYMEKNKGISLDEHYWLITIYLYGNNETFDNIVFRKMNYMVNDIFNRGRAIVFPVLDKDFHSILRSNNYLFVRKITYKTIIKYDKYL